MSDKNIIEKECYICFKPCKHKSPCSCQSFVHKKCLKKWLKLKEQTSCSICKDNILYKKRYAMWCCC